MSKRHIQLRETHNIGPNSRELMIAPWSCPALTMFGIEVAGVSFVDYTYEFVRHAPPFAQVIACFGGSGDVLVDGKWQRCVAGTAYVTPPNVLHAYRTSGPSAAGTGEYAAPWQFCWMTRPNWLTQPAVGGDRPGLVGVDWSDLTSLHHSIESLYSEIMGRAEPQVMHGWATLIDSYTQRVIGPSSRLSAIWKVVGQDLSRPWTVPDLAEIVDLSTEHVRRLCRYELGCTPMSHVRKLRMLEAATLLASERYTVEAVASRVGYDSAFAFSSAFKRHTGFSPSECRLKLAM